MSNDDHASQSLKDSEEHDAHKNSAQIINNTEIVRSFLGDRSLVLIGLMGVGKSTVGKRLASRLNIPFVDADAAIEEAAAMTIADIFSIYGEASFRDGEKRVIARLLQSGAQVLATGGGAYMNEQTREEIAQNGVSVWLKADLDTLMHRVSRRSTRPLLKTQDPEGTMRHLMEQRYPVYAHAEYTVYSRDEPHDVVVDEILKVIAQSL